MNPLSAAKGDVLALAHLEGHNARPTQPLNHRRLHRYGPDTSQPARASPPLPPGDPAQHRALLPRSRSDTSPRSVD